MRYKWINCKPVHVDISSVYLNYKKHLKDKRLTLSWSFVVIVTEHANHARDHLKTEAELKKYDGWVEDGDVLNVIVAIVMTGLF